MMTETKTSQAKRKANNKWDKENMATLGCKVKKEDAEKFRAYAIKCGKTPNTILREYVKECISKENTNA